MRLTGLIDRLLKGGRQSRRHPEPSTKLPTEMQGKLCDALLNQIKYERRNSIVNGLYESLVISFVFNHEVIEGNPLTEWQTKDIFETREAIVTDLTAPKEVRQTANHTLLFDRIIDTLDEPLSCQLVKDLHFTLMDGIMASAGEWKSLPNGVSSIVTASPSDVPGLMEDLVNNYLRFNPSIGNIAKFHSRFEMIHPFQDGNGRTGRAIVFRECLRAGLTPLIVDETSKGAYYRHLHSAQTDDQEALTPFFVSMQDEFAARFAPLLSDRELANEIGKLIRPKEFDLSRDPGFTEPLATQKGDAQLCMPNVSREGRTNPTGLGL